MDGGDQPAGLAGRLVAAALISGVALAACGGTSPSGVPTVKKPTPSRSSVASTGDTSQPRQPKTKSHTTTAGGSLASQELAFSRCMRANGVPGFPDPNPGGSFTVHAGSGGIDPASPQYQAANAKCGKLLPGGGAGPTFNPLEGAALVKIAACMREHGIAGFPDPVRAPSGSLPPPKPGYTRITNFEGWLLEFPATIDLQSPAYARAAAACGAGFLNRPQ